MSIKKIDDWDWPDCLYEPDGYDRKRVPEATSRNMRMLAEKINEIIDSLNSAQPEREQK